MIGIISVLISIAAGIGIVVNTITRRRLLRRYRLSRARAVETADQFIKAVASLEDSRRR